MIAELLSKNEETKREREERRAFFEASIQWIYVISYK